jgi:hypothetical protein
MAGSAKVTLSQFRHPTHHILVESLCQAFFICAVTFGLPFAYDLNLFSGASDPKLLKVMILCGGAAGLGILFKSAFRPLALKYDLVAKDSMTQLPIQYTSSFSIA